MSAMHDDFKPKLVFPDLEFLMPGISMRTIGFNEFNLSPPFTLIYFEIQPQHATPLDQHEEKECWIVLKGGGILHYEMDHTRICAQDMLFFAPFKKHQVVNDSNELLGIVSIYW
jgi:mannose-6-phosphate isomerase-like protein (cupin superfamily)